MGRGKALSILPSEVSSVHPPETVIVRPPETLSVRPCNCKGDTFCEDRRRGVSRRGYQTLIISCLPFGVPQRIRIDELRRLLISVVVICKHIVVISNAAPAGIHRFRAVD